MNIELDSVSFTDIIADPQPHLSQRLNQLCQKITQSQDRNKGNYANILDQLGSFHMFHIAHTENEILSFAGVQKREMWNGWLRAMSRLYFIPEIRTKGLKLLFRPNKIHEKCISAELYYKILFLQMRDVDLKQFKGLFMSVEFLRRREFLTSLTERINHYKPADSPSWSMHPHMLLVCDDSNSINCWQNVNYMNSANLSELEEISTHEWTQRFLKQ